jgi:hypothetical protein
VQDLVDSVPAACAIGGGAKRLGRLDVVVADARRPQVSRPLAGRVRGPTDRAPRVPAPQDCERGERRGGP